MTQSDTGAAYVMSLSMKDACVRFYNDSGSAWRSELFSADPHAYAVMHGFSEFSLGYQKLLVARPESPRAFKARSRRCRRVDGVGMLIPFTLNNIFHATFHAVPAWEQWRAIDAQQVAHGGSAVHFLPLVYRSAALGAIHSADPSRWFAWEYTLRALTRLSGDEISRRTKAALQAGCCCFSRLEAAAPAFNVYSRSSRDQLRHFRRAVLANALVTDAAFAGTGIGREVLYIPRESSVRAVTNEVELSAALGEVPALRRVVFDRIPLGEQLRLVSRAIGIVSVFGQALSWMLFLPTEEVRTFCVEMIPNEGGWKRDYVSWAKVLGVRFFRVRGAIAAGACRKDDKKLSAAWQGKLRNFTRFLDCNLTVPVHTAKLEVVAAIEGAVVRKRPH